MSRVDARMLAAFAALMAERSVTRAASRCGLTQQGMSGQLARLRLLFDDPLFMRHAGGVAPTKRAEALAPAVEAALAAIRALGERPVFDPARASGEIAVAASDYAMALLAPPLLARLRTEAPGLRLIMRPVFSSSLAEDMKTERFALALTAQEFSPPGLRARVLFSDRYVGVCRADHPVAAGPVTAEVFCAHPHLLVSPDKGDATGATDLALAAVGMARRVALVVPSFSVVGALLEATDLLAVIPERLFGLTRRRLHAFAPPVPVAGFRLEALWPARLDADPLHGWMRRALIEAARGLSAASPRPADS